MSLNWRQKEKQNSNLFWTRANGQKVPIEEMGDHHLLSSIAMMKRNGYVSAADYSLYMTDPGPSAEMAQDAFAMEQDEMLERRPSALLDALESEAHGRGILR